MKYPIYGKSKRTGTVVEFTEIAAGTVIFTNNRSSYKIGDYSNDWYYHTDTDMWEIVSKENNPEEFI